MKIDKQFVIICFMVLMLCFTFFFIGYGTAYRQAANSANKFVREVLSQEIIIPGRADYYSNLFVNLTFNEETT